MKDLYNKAEHGLENMPLVNGGYAGKRTCLQAFFGVFLPPVLIYIRKDKFTQEFFICLLLTLLLWIPGTLYAFHQEGIEPLHNVLCYLVPPVGLYLGTKK